MKLAHEPAGNDALDWSDDNQIAVVSEKCVNIFVSWVNMMYSDHLCLAYLVYFK